MEVKKIIDNQNVYIDSHQQGDRQEIKKEFLHLHKKMNGKKFKGWEIQIYLESDDVRVDYKKGFDNESTETKNVKNEIEQIFKGSDDTKIKQLIRDLHKAIRSYGNSLSNNGMEDKLTEWAGRIADGFGLKSSIKDKIVNKSLEYMTFITSHEDASGKVYFLKQDTNPKRIPIAMSDDINELYNRTKL
jgi:hypothetical protein